MNILEQSDPLNYSNNFWGFKHSNHELYYECLLLNSQMLIIRQWIRFKTIIRGNTEYDFIMTQRHFAINTSTMQVSYCHHFAEVAPKFREIELCKFVRYISTHKRNTASKFREFRPPYFVRDLSTPERNI